jgi:hypothetical protein
MKIYIDGIEVTYGTPTGTPAATYTSTSFNWWLGAMRHTSPSFNMIGNLDEVAIFDYSLTSSEVSDIYNSGIPNDLMSLITAKKPEHYWRMGDDDTNSTITNIGNTAGNNGTMTNMEFGDSVSDVP